MRRPLRDRWHYHVCQACGFAWRHNGAILRSKEETKQLHMCDKCGSGPYLEAMTQLRALRWCMAIMKDPLIVPDWKD